MLVACDDVVAGAHHTGESGIDRVEFDILLDKEQILLHLTVGMGGSTMDATIHVGSGVGINPYKHAHIAIMGGIGDCERHLELPTAADLGTIDGKTAGALGDILYALEIVDTIAVVVDDDT